MEFYCIQVISSLSTHHELINMCVLCVCVCVCVCQVWSELPPLQDHDVTVSQCETLSDQQQAPSIFPFSGVFFLYLLPFRPSHNLSLPLPLAASLSLSLLLLCPHLIPNALQLLTVLQWKINLLCISYLSKYITCLCVGKNLCVWVNIYIYTVYTHIIPH